MQLTQFFNNAFLIDSVTKIIALYHLVFWPKKLIPNWLPIFLPFPLLSSSNPSYPLEIPHYPVAIPRYILAIPHYPVAIPRYTLAIPRYCIL